MNKYLEKIAGMPRSLTRLYKNGVKDTVNTALGKGVSAKRADAASRSVNAKMKQAVKWDQIKKTETVDHNVWPNPLKAFAKMTGKMDFKANAIKAKSNKTVAQLDSLLTREARAKRAKTLSERGAKKSLSAVGGSMLALGGVAGASMKNKKD